MLNSDVPSVDGASDAMSPAGKPDTDKLTFPEKPFGGTIAIEVSPPVHWSTLRLEGDALRLKPAFGSRDARGPDTEEHDDMSKTNETMHESLQRAGVGKATADLN
jgi:hypothetical protein